MTQHVPQPMPVETPVTINPVVESIKRERDRFVAFAFAAADMLMEIDQHGVILFADGATSGLLGIAPSSLSGQSFHEIIHELDRPVMDNLLQTIAKKQRVDNIPMAFQSKTLGTMLQMSVSAFYYGKLDHHVFLSISSRINSKEHEDLRDRDAKTGTLNKTAFAEQANTKILEAEKRGEKLELTLVDFPELEAILKSLSAEQATKLLKEIGAYLQSKSLDGDLAATLDEKSSFGLLHTPDVTSKEIISTIQTMVSHAAPDHNKISGHSQTIKTAPGVLTKQDSANALLYTLNKYAESHGEGFSIDSIGAGYQSMLDETVTRMSNFRDVVTQEMFDIAYQPIVDIKSGIVHHYECLVRLKDEANHNFSNPYHFINFGETSGLINDFDLLMTQKTIAVLLEAKKQGKRPLVSVNVSGRSLSSVLFMDSMRRLIQAEPSIRKQLILEITESAKIADLKVANAFVQELRRDGTLVCLDDFGSGESSFDYLRSLQVDFIKIDGSYVKESMQNQQGRDMLRAMAGLCRSLNMVTIGEMVEDEKCAVFLWESGVKFGQGYFFGKPNTDESSLELCSKLLPHYPGILRAKRFKNEEIERAWWSRRGD